MNLLDQTTEAFNSELRIAVLIDADNVSAKYIEPMMQEIASYGQPTIKRIYGDWTKPNLNNWKSLLLNQAIIPMQQFSYTTGKNATDSSMIIDAMDILYSGNVDAFCLVSSDSDFTRLAMRLRESGMTVFGFGERKTPQPFINACDRFIYAEVLQESDDKAPVVTGQKDNEKRDKSNIDAKTIAMIERAIMVYEDDSGWADLGSVGSLIMKLQPSFDTRKYGFSKLSNMLRSVNHFELKLFAVSKKASDKVAKVRINRKR